MKILVDINHPGHVHFFKYFIWEMEKKGYEIIVTASKKDISFNLLDDYGIEYINMGSYGRSFISKLINLPIKDIGMLIIALKYKPDILMGIASNRICHVSWLLRKKALVFDDTDFSRLEIALYKPFATKIFTPACFLVNLGEKQVRYNGCHELAYLHPRRFKPNPSVLKEVGLSEGYPFFVVRFISWDATQDIGQKGYSKIEKNKLINLLKKHGKVFITSESPLPDDLEKYRLSIPPIKIHDLMYYATMYVGESNTMATESAILGTPSILISPLAKKCGIHNELHDIYNLQFFFDRYEDSFDTIIELLNNKNLKKEWILRKERYISEKIDVTDFLIKIIENSSECRVKRKNRHENK